jgi:MFS family permease
MAPDTAASFPLSQDQVRTATVLFYSAALIQGLCQTIIPAASVILKLPEYNGLSDRQYGVSFLPLIATMILSTSLFPRLFHRFGAAKIFFAGMFADFFFFAALWAAGTAASPFRSFVALLLANAFLGFAFGWIVGVLNAVLAGLHPKHCDAALSGLHGFLVVGFAVSPLWISWFHGVSHWAGVIFPIAAGMLAVAYVLVRKGIFSQWQRVASCGLPRHETFAGTPGDFPPLIALILFALFVYGAVESVLGNWSSVYLASDKGLSLRSGPLCLAVFWGAVMLGRLLTGFWAVRMDSRRLLCLVPAVLLGGLMLIVRIRTEADLYLAFLTAGFGCSCFYPVSVSLGIETHAAWRDALSGFGLGAVMVGVLAGSPVVGLLRELNWIRLEDAYRAAMGCSALLLILACVITSLASKKPSP